jgi:hypothetical protein
VLREFVTDNGHPWRHYPDVLPSVWPRFVGDVNGDGMPDLIAFDEGEIKVAHSSDQPPPLIAAPSNVHMTHSSPSGMTIAWNDNSNNERRFFIYYGKSGGERSVRITANANATTSVFGPLSANTRYCFTVQAESIFGLSAESLVACGNTAAQPTPTPTPTPAPTPTPSGISSINVFNCNVDQRPVFIWTRDVTQSTWVQRGSLPAQYTNGSCPGNSAPLAVPLQDGHSFWFVAVDPQLIGCGGQNNPEFSACQRSIFTQPLPGKANGPVLRHVIN